MAQAALRSCTSSGFASRVSRCTATVASANGRTVVSLRGEIDLDSVRPIADWLSAAIAHDDADIVVEMCDVTFIDSAGLCVLVRGAEFL